MDARLKEDFGADSIDGVQIIMALEDEFGIKLEDESLEEIKTVGDIVKFVKAVL